MIRPGEEMSSHGGESQLPQFRFRFGTAEFDEARFDLCVSGLPVEVQRKPLEILALLLSRPGEVVTKEELLEAVWKGRPTVENVLANAVAKLRGALGEENAARITTVPRVGYRFDGPLQRIAVGRVFVSPLELRSGAAVPGRESFLLERPLGRTLGSEVWLARQPRTRDVRVFKFSLDGEQLGAIKREATMMRVLRDTLGERDDFVRVYDWNFESPPFFLECEYGGEALPEWAAGNGHLAAMDRSERIAFFARIAEAIAAAHSVGVLHKDLKPANILAAPDGGGWRPRLTDFGSSRLLQPERLEQLGITRLGLTVERHEDSGSGTPLYLAPELIAGEPPTVRSDIYALGVILYQLLAGDFRRPMAPGWEREIDDPLLRQDIAEATDSDPARRLANAGELADRLRRLPQRHAERARREAGERAAAALRRTLERNRARRPWVIAAMVVLAVGATCSSLLWWRSEQQRHIAQRQIARAEAMVRFLDHALSAISTGNSGHGNDATIRDMLRFASVPGNGYLSADPEVRGDIHSLLGRSWRNLGDAVRGVAEYRTAVRGYAEAFGEDHELTLRTRYALVRTLAYVQTPASFAEARALLAETDRLLGARLEQDHPLALQAALERGILELRQLRVEPALEALRRADGLQRRVLPEDAGIAALIRGNVADALRRAGRPDEVLDWLRAVLADPLMELQQVGAVGMALFQAAEAGALHDLGRHAEALPLAQTAARTSSRYLGARNYLPLVQKSLLASIHDALGNCPAALQLAREVHEGMLQEFGEEMQATLIETGNLGLREYECGDRALGLEYLRRAEGGLRLGFGEDNLAARHFRDALTQSLAGAARSEAGPQTAGAG
jgi:serine/threonine protein kinase/DNA-binding winged helix-turn-helix (wHTH) protein